MLREQRRGEKIFSEVRGCGHRKVLSGASRGWTIGKAGSCVEWRRSTATLTAWVANLTGHAAKAISEKGLDWASCRSKCWNGGHRI